MLGGLLLNNEAWERIGDMVDAADFYRDDHRKIYHAISRLIESNKPADALTVAESLQLSGELQAIGGMAYLQSLVDGTPSAANIRLYAEIVKERAIMRQSWRAWASKSPTLRTHRRVVKHASCSTKLKSWYSISPKWAARVASIFNRCLHCLRR